MSSLPSYIDLIDKNTLHNIVTKLKSQGIFNVYCDVDGTYLIMREYPYLEISVDYRQEKEGDKSIYLTLSIAHTYYFAYHIGSLLLASWFLSCLGWGREWLLLTVILTHDIIFYANKNKYETIVNLFNDVLITEKYRFVKEKRLFEIARYYQIEE
jgi:hypothetical protein